MKTCKPAQLSKAVALGIMAAWCISGTNLVLAAPEADLPLEQRPALIIPEAVVVPEDKPLELVVQEGEFQLLPGKKTRTYGINMPILGKTLLLRSGQKFSVKITNNLKEPTVIHWHGLIVPGNFDGGPESEIPAGATVERSTTLWDKQPAATVWYHTHLHHKTAYQTAMGMGGVIVLQDANSDRINKEIPSTYGVDDIPVAIQGKRFDENNQIKFVLNETSGSVGWLGQKMFVNAAQQPVHHAPKGWLRLRLLDATNARNITYKFADGRKFYAIATEGGFLEKPVPLTQAEIIAGERMEILVDASDGKPLDLVMVPSTEQIGTNQPPFDKDYLLMSIIPDLADKTGVKLDIDKLKLVDMPSIADLVPDLNSIKVRNINLVMKPEALKALYDYKKNPQPKLLDTPTAMTSDHKKIHELNAMSVDDSGTVAYDMGQSLFTVKRGTYEIWNIVAGAYVHPFHVHGTQFRILKENGKDPVPERAGWKDMVKVSAGSASKILVYFPFEATKEYPYMTHCHLLEHEETGMMVGFSVLDNPDEVDAKAEPAVSKAATHEHTAE